MVSRNGRGACLKTSCRDVSCCWETSGLAPAERSLCPSAAAKFSHYSARGALLPDSRCASEESKLVLRGWADGCRPPNKGQTSAAPRHLDDCDIEQLFASG